MYWINDLDQQGFLVANISQFPFHNQIPLQDSREQRHHRETDDNWTANSFQNVGSAIAKICHSLLISESLQDELTCLRLAEPH